MQTANSVFFIKTLPIRLITATFGTQFPNEKQAEKFLCDNLPKIEEYFMQEDILEEGIEGRFEIIDKEIKCDI